MSLSRHPHDNLPGGFTPWPHRNAYQPEATAVLSGAIIFAIIVCNIAAAQFFHLVLR